MEYITNSVEQTIQIGKTLAERFTGGEVVTLSGDLGAGKTAFSKGIALGLGVSGNVSSPTFTIVKTYNGRLVFNHLDLYRINDVDELIELGFDELFTNDSVTVIEWAENAKGNIPGTPIKITITRIDDDRRKIII